VIEQAQADGVQADRRVVRILHDAMSDEQRHSAKATFRRHGAQRGAQKGRRRKPI
jgi:hypothetical protein